jgi:hypothetical protein
MCGIERLRKRRVTVSGVTLSVLPGDAPLRYSVLCGPLTGELHRGDTPPLRVKG